MSAYLILATGTGIGKTFATCALLHAAQHKAIPAQGFKPIISGWNAADPTSDTAQIMAASGGQATVEEVSPWRFTAPLAPHRAAALEGTTLDIAALTDWTHARAQSPSLTLIEGVGGVMVPLTDTTTTLDWAAQLRLPIILVTGSYLGTISHTLTALLALRSRGLTVAALIINETPGSSVSLAETQAGFTPFTHDIALQITQPLVSSWQEATAIHTLVERL